MATMTSTDTQVSTAATETGTDRAELRDIPLSRIIVPAGFNPRGEVVDDAELEAMAETMRQRGCLQPVRVRATGDGEYALVAGERRYRAAVKAALTVLPAVVRPAGLGDESERLDLLIEAMIENEVRSDLNPLQRALGYQAMIDCGLSVRGVAERMGGKAKRGSRERRIREHLAILALPESVRELVAVEKVPLLAVKALAALATIHEELPAYAVGAVLDVDEHTEPYTWSEVAEHALDVAVSHCYELPAGLYLSSKSYPGGSFELDEKAKRDLAAYNKLTNGQVSAVRFNFEHIDQARLLGVAHKAGHATLIVGTDVACRLAEDYIAGVLKEARANDRRRRELERQRNADDGTGPAAVAASLGDGSEPRASGDTKDTEKDAEAKRKEEREKREAAVRFNLEFGVLAFKHLPKIKVDERALRILASVDLGRSLRVIATRGARLSMPGWVTQSEQRNGKIKTTYLDTYDAERRAVEFLDGAVSAADIAGRTLTLIALASLTNETDALPQSRRSHYLLGFRGPWAVQAERDLDAIVRERIKEGQLPVLDGILSARITSAEERIRRAAERASAKARVESALPGLAEGRTVLSIRSSATLRSLGASTTT